MIKHENVAVRLKEGKLFSVLTIFFCLMVGRFSLFSCSLSIVYFSFLKMQFFLSFYVKTEGLIFNFYLFFY